MLAQNFKTAKELELTDKQYEALLKTLVVLETDRVKFVTEEQIRDALELDEEMDNSDPGFSGHFSMTEWDTPVVLEGEKTCATVACIGGTAELLIGEYVFSGGTDYPIGLSGLFYPGDYSEYWRATHKQAAIALRGYLTTGEVDWARAMKEGE